MQQCSIYDKSLRFSRAVYGIIILLAFFLDNYWLILAVVILLVLGTFSIKLNLAYQLHVFCLRNLLKKNIQPIKKETAELSFVSGMTAAMLLLGFLLLYFNQYVVFAKIWILLIALLIFLACFAGFCIASLSYALLLKVLKIQRNEIS